MRKFNAKRTAGGRRSAAIDVMDSRNILFASMFYRECIEVETLNRFTHCFNRFLSFIQFFYRMNIKYKISKVNNI